MPRRYQASIMSGTYRPLLTPNAPTSVTATAGSSSASVAFTAPANVGGGAITSYTVVSSGGQYASGSSSPLTVTGLTNGVSYTFTVFATNSYGNGPASVPSSGVTPAAISSVDYLVVAGGGGGGGFNGGSGGGAGGMRTGSLSVSSGVTYTVTVGAGGNGANVSATPTAGSNSVFYDGILRNLYSHSRRWWCGSHVKRRSGHIWQ